MKKNHVLIGFGNPTESSRLDREGLAKAWKENCKLFSQSGVHIFFPHVELVDCWLDDRTYDFSVLDSVARTTINADPDARLILRLRSNVPLWWHEKHPGQEIRYHDGADRITDHHWRPGTRPASLASEQWHSDLAALYREAVLHVQDSDFADRVIGYNPAGMHGGEWFEEGSMYDLMADYSDLMEAAFRDYLRSKYPDNDIGDVRVPSPAERQRGDIGIFRDPVKSGRIIDYYLLHQELIASLAERCCKAIKHASDGTALVGIYYGYTVELAAVKEHPGWIQDSGHLALKRIVSSPHIDYLSSMLEYVYRAPGGFCWSFGSIADSCRAHGKFYIGEDEILTWRNKSDPSIFSYIKPIQNAVDAANIIKRNFACMLSHSSGHEFVDLSGGWYNDPAIMEAISAVATLASESGRDHSPVAQIAVCVDETSFMYQGIAGTGAFNRALVLDSLLPLFHIGAPVDLFLLSDLTDGCIPLDQYRFVVLLNAFFMDETQREYLKNRVFGGQRSVLSYYAPGFLSPRGGSIEGIHGLTGVRVQIGNDAEVVRVRAGDQEYGMDSKISPVFFVDDREAEVLGRLTCNGKPGLCRRRFSEWTSIYSAAPRMPAGMLRGFAKEAGVHFFVESDDLIHATKSMVAIHAGVSGDKRIILPVVADVVDPFGGQKKLEAVDKIELDMNRGETRVWLIES